MAGSEAVTTVITGFFALAGNSGPRPQHSCDDEQARGISIAFTSQMALTLPWTAHARELGTR